VEEKLMEDVDVTFENILLAENKSRDESYRKGEIEGRLQGLTEGRKLGWEKGQEMGEEVSKVS
jgi:flagellar biosynthesis/type III secretory pathway protein FliH